MIDECQSVLDTRPHVFPAVSDHVLLLEQQARSKIAITQEQAIAGILDAIRPLMALLPEQKMSPIGLPMTIARKSRRWRDGDACGTRLISMLTHIVQGWFLFVNLKEQIIKLTRTQANAVLLLNMLLE